MTLKDANGVELGIITSLPAESSVVEIYTSTGHVLGLNWDGTMSPSQIYYTGGGCTGTAYLNSGWEQAPPTWAGGVVYSGSLNTLMAIDNADANGLSPNVAFTKTGFDNPTCGTTSGTSHGYLLTAVTPTAVGLPAFPVATPLSISTD